jgi:tRNA G18 (ribose-2'-O)-methylase SpoU
MKNVEIVVILYNLRSVYNTASIFRTVDASGIVSKIYLCGTTPTPKDRFNEWRQDFIKVSLGAEKNILWKKINTIFQTLKLIKNLKNNGYKIWSIEQSKNSIPYYLAKKEVKQSSKIVLILGNEVKGIPPSILKISDKILEIPMAGKLIKNKKHPKYTKANKESLNVSVAFGIILFGVLC